MIPARLAPILVAIIVSGGMSFLVSGLATWRAIGLPPGFVETWMTSWVFAWAIAFPALMILRPIVVKFVARWVKEVS